MIGHKLKEIRDERKMKQESMAELLGISQTKYCRVERNEYAIDLEEAKNYAEKLGLDEGFFEDSNNGYTIINNNNKIETQVENNYNYSISPEIKKLYEDKFALIEEIKNGLKEQNDSLKEDNITLSNKIIELTETIRRLQS